MRYGSRGVATPQKSRQLELVELGLKNHFPLKRKETKPTAEASADPGENPELGRRVGTPTLTPMHNPRSS